MAGLGLRLGLKRLRIRLGRSAASSLGLNRTVYVSERTKEYRRYWEEAATLAGADFRVLADGIWEISRDGVRTRIAGHFVGLDDPVTLKIAGDKLLSYTLATRAGVPVPPHQPFTLETLDSARAFYGRHGGPVVVKPTAGSSSGLGVTTQLDSLGGIENAALLASLFCPQLLIESMIPAESVRLLFLDGQLVHAVRRRGVRVTGDGRKSVRTLLDDVGAPSDRATLLTLAAQDMTLEHVPGAGEELVARCLPADTAGSRELRTIYNETITPLVAPALVEQASRVVRALGSRFAGVDLMTNDPTRPLEATGGAFLEINTTPGLHHHYQDAEELRTHPVAMAVLDALLTRAPAVVGPYAI